MNDDAVSIQTALERRFSRVAVPPCPAEAWHAAEPAPATNARPRRVSRRFAYAAALLAAVAIAGLTAQASTVIQQSYAKLVGPSFLSVSSKPLMPLIHAADRLTIAEAQRRIPFPIVVPAGLPPGTRFQYAHVVSQQPIPRVSLNYEAHFAQRYYRINVNETTVAVGPPVAHFEFRNATGVTKRSTLPLRRWKHGNVVMELHAWGLPAAMSDRIARANTTPAR
jgi:hypothetical protein